MVGEGVVLGGVEDLEQRGGGVAAEGVGAQLVDLVQHEDGIVGADPLELLDDASGQGADVGATEAADGGFVADAAQREAHELASDRAGDALAQGGFADAGWSDEAEDGATRVGAQLAHGEVVQDALLDLFEIEVVLVEHGAGGVDVDLVWGGDAPGEVGDPLQVGTGAVVLGRHGVDGGESSELLVGFFARDV